jgi:hypothetical protein
MLFFILLIASVILIMLFCKNGYSLEHYGQIKSIHRIPKTECYNICRMNYGQCMSEFQNIDPGACVNKYQNCVSVCNYTDYHMV